MLIYNHKKELLGIDESDLNTLGFKNLAELNSEVSDFADFFVKKPGFVHNFKHVHWIDFVNASGGGSNLSVIINAKNKVFNALLQIKTIYLSDEPSLKGYIVNLQNIREDGAEILADTKTANILNQPKHMEENNTFQKNSNISMEEEYNEDLPDLENYFSNEPKKEIIEDSIELDFEHENNDDEITTIDLELPKTSQKQEPNIQQNQIQIQLEEEFEDDDDDYVYDPHIASDELGLPIDLIEEFIGDFIMQSKDFKNELYSSLETNDLENVKNLSHKLKGVSANLRIDNAFEVLSIINTSNNISEIKQNLNKFYKIISKLAGETTQPAKKKIQQPIDDEIKIDIEQENDDIFNDDIFLSTEDANSIDLPDMNKLEISEKLDDNTIDLPDLNVDDTHTTNTEDDDETQNIKYYKQLVAHELGISDETFNELLDDFILESKRLSTSIKNAAIQDNADLWKREAIKFKGMSENMRLKDFTGDLDTIIHTQNKDEVIESINHINTALQKISNI